MPEIQLIVFTSYYFPEVRRNQQGVNNVDIEQNRLVHIDDRGVWGIVKITKLKLVGMARFELTTPTSRT